MIFFLFPLLVVFLFIPYFFFSFPCFSFSISCSLRWLFLVLHSFQDHDILGVFVQSLLSSHMLSCR